MPVLTINLAEVNYLAGDAASYALVSVEGELLFLATSCPHRGGPLHLGEVARDARGRAGLRCPWHGTFISVAQLRQTALPMVWRAQTGDASLVLPAGSEFTAMLRHPHTRHEPAARGCAHIASCAGAVRRDPS